MWERSQRFLRRPFRGGYPSLSVFHPSVWAFISPLGFHKASGGSFGPLEISSSSDSALPGRSSFFQQIGKTLSVLKIPITSLYSYPLGHTGVGCSGSSSIVLGWRYGCLLGRLYPVSSFWWVDFQVHCQSYLFVFLYLAFVCHACVIHLLRLLWAIFTSYVFDNISRSNFVFCFFTHWPCNIGYYQC